MQCLIPARNFQFGKIILSSAGTRRRYQFRTFTSTGSYQRTFNLLPPKFNSNGNQFSSLSPSPPKPDHHPAPEGSEQPSLRHVKVRHEKSAGSTTPNAEGDEESRGGLNGELGSWEWLNDYGPCYAVHGSQVTVIQTPDEFYQVLLEEVKSATRRVTLASLYLGTGTLESELVSALKEKMQKAGGLQVKVLLDYTRGSRGVDNSRTMLTPLMDSGRPSTCQVFLYHTPKLIGARKKILPQRWNELVGIQHMKIYIFDDSVLITGANLSNDYFTNRQDRYVLVENCPELADFYDGLISSVSTFSFQMDTQNNVQLHSGWTLDPATGDSKLFIEAARCCVLNYYEQCRETTQRHFNNISKSSRQGRRAREEDTWISPLIQMGPFHISYDDEATLRVLERPSPGSKIKLATGYFNLTPNFSQSIIHKSKAHFQILMAHPKANGFLGAKFPAGGIPAAYTLLATRFFNAVRGGGQESRIEMYEYLRPDWTFHGKGLWFYPPGESTPFVTLIGSPNFGYRSKYRDLETQLYIVTTNKKLRMGLESEQCRLYSQSNPFEEDVFAQTDRLVPLWVHLVLRFFKNFF